MLPNRDSNVVTYSNSVYSGGWEYLKFKVAPSVGYVFMSLLKYFPSHNFYWVLVPVTDNSPPFIIFPPVSSGEFPTL